MAEPKGRWQTSQGRMLTAVLGGIGLAVLTWALLAGVCGASRSTFCTMIRNDPPWLLLLALGAAWPLMVLWTERERLRRQAADRQADELANARAVVYTDLFFRSMNLLKAESLEARLAGIYSLERLSRDSQADHWTVVETLAAYVRSRAMRMADLEQDEEDVGRPPSDIQAALTVLARRSWRQTEQRFKIDLTNTDLRWTDLKQAHFAHASFEDANLMEADLTGADLVGVNLSEAELKRAFLVEADLAGASLIKADLANAVLVEANLQRADLEMANLTEAVLPKSDLSRAKLPKAVLAGAVLPKANLRGAQLQQANLCGANLTAADLSKADLTRADLTGADLKRANLEGADLEHAILTQANLAHTNLKGAILWKANLSGADLMEADLTGAIYHPMTLFPNNFNPIARGMILEEEAEQVSTVAFMSPFATTQPPQPDDDEDQRLLRTVRIPSRDKQGTAPVLNEKAFSGESTDDEAEKGVKAYSEMPPPPGTKPEE